jgi:hypothetical protein
MNDIEALIRHIGQVKARMDNGMCRVGTGLDKNRRTDALLTGDASRCVGLADAVVQLCRQEHPSEALPVLRHLADIVTEMAWVLAARDPETRACEAFDEAGRSCAGLAWPPELLLERARLAGLPASEPEELLGAAREFARCGRSALPWSHLFSENQSRSQDSAAVLRMTVRWMARALKALDARWPGSFPGGDELLA